MPRLLLILCFTFFSATKIYSQTTDTTFSFSKNYIWGTLGFGLSYPYYLNYNLGTTYLFKNRHAFQINYFGLGTHPREDRLHELKSFIFSYGISSSIKKYHSIIISTGLSYGNGIYYGKDTATDNNHNWLFPFSAIQEHKYIMTPYNYYGLYFSGQYLIWTPYYGLGLKIYCNIHKYTDYGITLSYNLGYLNKR